MGHKRRIAFGEQREFQQLLGDADETASSGLRHRTVLGQRELMRSWFTRS
ncbi:hypothetical protein ACTZWT_14345 [Rhodopseudomonas sp. NSM]